ncbi:MAG: Putative inner membrane protein [uncultured Gemmatimonadetes bacterium]|uniref:Inner membrane protein n=1 Tax=uncultured Gemmatimonadota bacterium TaxID=203437 RepID=A0A6J4KSG8_9BACT|nr:MAG: Putative inner membrane protein [uncultured Gemmatimonadota bacterium]
MTAILQRFTQIRREEAAAVLASGLSFFFILTALMVLRPAREALGMQRGIEAVRWLFLGTAVATLAVNPLFGLLVSRTRRLVFITATYLFFAASLLVFYTLLVMAPAAFGETSGMVFFVWYSVFNLFAMMVLWGLMADRFSLEQSKRLFGVIAVGGTLGAIAGPWLASRLTEPLGTAGLLLVAAGLLGLAALSVRVVAHLQPERTWPAASDAPEAPPAVDERAVIGGSAWEGLRAVFRSPYLLGISAYVLIMAVIATFLYFTRLQMVAALGEGLDMRTTAFARIDLYVQLTTLVLQALVAGKLMKQVGVSATLALLPITAALGFLGLALVASLAALVVFQSAFNAADRAIMRPARETLFTVVSRTDKYKSKAFIDTFVYRGGDVVGAQVEGVLGRLGMGLAALISVSVPLAFAWAALGVWLGRQQERQAEHRPATAPVEIPARAEVGAL